MTRLRRILPGTYVYVGVTLAVLAGVAVVAAGRWQSGVTLAGAALLVAGVVRAALPERLAGQLRIRRRMSDVPTMLALGAALVTLAIAVPTPPV